MIETNTTPEGIRNNNPGNILSSDRFIWRGQIGTDHEGKCIFDTPVHGLRAICIQIVTYQVHDGCKTLDDYIGMWSKGYRGGDPNYARCVAAWCHTNADEPFDIHTHAQELLAAIVRFENGEQPYHSALLLHAIAMSHIR